MGNKIVEVDDSGFWKIVKQNGKVIVDFWASWCAPCQLMAPIFESLSGKFDGKVLFAKMNVDANSEVPMKLKVLAIPTFVVFKNGKEEARLVGALSEDSFEKFIRRSTT